MPLDRLTGKLTLPRRDEIRDRYLRDFGLYHPDADTGEGSQAWVDASTFADSEVVHYSNAARIAGAVSVRGTYGEDLDALLEEEGTARLPATGASGFVTVSTSSGGGYINAGDEGKVGGIRYECAIGGYFTAGQAVAVVARLDTGPKTDQVAGAGFTWSRPRPGIAPKAVVASGGLTGGHDVESDGEAQERLIRLRQTPAASGNDADYQEAALKAPGLAVEQAFTYPGVRGPGTIALAFTLRRSALGGVRIPNAGQIAIMRAHLRARFRADDSLFVCALIAQPVDIALRVAWAPGAAGWYDLIPECLPQNGSPPYDFYKVETPTGYVATPLDFSISPIGLPPANGKTIAVWDPVSRRFYRKKVLATASDGAFKTRVTVADDGLSDASYTPVPGTLVSPWSDSLDQVVSPVQQHLDTVGPGEQFASFFDPGRRQKRSPSATTAFPSVLSNKLLAPLFATQGIGDALLISPEIPFETTVGSPTVSAYLLTLNSIGVYPL